MNNDVFGKTLENVRKHRDINLVTTDKRRNQLVPKPNYWTIKGFSENLVAIEMKKAKVKMNNPVYLGFSILEISKTLMYEFWYNCIKSNYQDNSNLCYMDRDSFIIYIKTEDFYEHITDDVICLLMEKKSLNLRPTTKMLTFQESISTGFSASEFKKVFLNGNVYDFSVDYDSIVNSGILNTRKYLMTKKIVRVIISMI